MAVSVTANLTDVDLAEASTDWSDGSTFGTTGTSLLSGDGVFKQGTDSQSAKVAKNNSNWIQWIGTAKDMSATDVHLYWWILTAIRPSMTAMEIRIGDSAGAYTGWTIDAFTLWDGSWKCFVQDLAATPDTSSGTIDLTDVTIVSVLFNTVGANFRAIENVWVDACRFGTGLTATGTDFDIEDMAADDQLVANQYGILQTIDGVVFSQGRLNIGNGATTTTFNSTNEVLVFRDAAVSSTLYELNLVGSGNVTVAADLTLRSAGTTDNARFYFDASDTGADITIDGVAITRAGLIDFSSATDIQNFTFNDCFQIVPSTGVFKTGTVKNYVGTDGAVLFPSTDANISSISFQICDNGVEYDAGSDATSPAFDDLTFDDEAGNYDVNNTSGAEISISKNNGSNPNSYNPGGDIVNFLGASVTTKITARDADDASLISDARVLAWVTSGVNFPYQVGVTIAGSGTTATVTHTTHGLATNDNILIEGANEENYIGAYQITVTGVSTYTYTTAESTGGNPATGSPIATFAILNGDTVAGVISDTRVVGSDQPFDYRVRKSTTSPLYRQGKGSDTISSTTGKEITVSLVSDEG